MDTSAATALPNVQVLTGADVDAPPFGPPPYWNINPGMVRPLVASDVVRFAGEIVAIIVSEDRVSGSGRGGARHGRLRPASRRPNCRGRREGGGAALPGSRDERRRDGRLA